MRIKHPFFSTEIVELIVPYYIVATEAWSSNYRSSISSSRHINHKKVQQRLSQHDLESHRPPLPHSSHHIVSRTRDAEDKIMDPRSFVHKYLEAARGYREHANYFLVSRFDFPLALSRVLINKAYTLSMQHGRTGDTPRKLHYLIDSTDEFDEEFKKLGKEGDKVVKGSVGHVSNCTLIHPYFSKLTGCLIVFIHGSLRTYEFLSFPLIKLSGLSLSIYYRYL